MRCNLGSDPRVLKIADALELPELHVVGLLWRFWSWADQHTTNNSLDVSESLIDRITCPGFSEQLKKVGWLTMTQNGVELPNFEQHNGTTAKMRASGQKRTAAHRKRSASVTPDRYTCNGKVTVERQIRNAVLTRDGFTCVYCGRKKGEIRVNEGAWEGEIGLDHVIPESQGGATISENLVACCNLCNSTKRDRKPDEAGLRWPVDVTGKRYGCNVEALPEKRREEKRVDNTPLPPTQSDPLPAFGPAFASAWGDWIQHRKEKRKPVTPLSAKQALKDLEAMGADRAIAAIRHSIGKGWTGIFEPDRPAGKTPPVAVGTYQPAPGDY